jgi:hypothetical protein
MSPSSEHDVDVDGVAALAAVLLCDFFVAVLIARGAFIFSVLWLVLNSPMA